jgi:hypothetical protein
MIQTAPLPVTSGGPQESPTGMRATTLLARRVDAGDHAVAAVVVKHPNHTALDGDAGELRPDRDGGGTRLLAGSMRATAPVVRLATHTDP